MEDKFCKVCGFKTVSKSKGRKVLCKCEWEEFEPDYL
jgi:hypothetical protein